MQSSAGQTGCAWVGLSACLAAHASSRPIAALSPCLAASISAKLGSSPSPGGNLSPIISAIACRRAAARWSPMAAAFTVVIISWRTPGQSFGVTRAAPPARNRHVIKVRRILRRHHVSRRCPRLNGFGHLLLAGLLSAQPAVTLGIHHKKMRGPITAIKRGIIFTQALQRAGQRVRIAR